MTPFCEGENDCKEFTIIDVIVAFSGEEGTRKVGTGVEIAIGISLEQNGTSHEQRGIGHD